MFLVLNAVREIAYECRPTWRYFRDARLTHFPSCSSDHVGAYIRFAATGLADSPGNEVMKMPWLQTAVAILHMFLSVGIIALVLLQRGKGADAGAGFGAGASGTVFGAHGSASFLSRTTAAFVILFFITSLTLAYFGNRELKTTSVMDRVSAPTDGGSSNSARLRIPDSSTTEPAAVESAPNPPVRK